MPIVPEPGPLRQLAVATLVNTAGSGLWLTGGALFLTRSVGLTPTSVGLGFSVGGAVGLLAGVPLGAVADAWGPRRVAVGLLLCEALATAALITVHSFSAFVLVAVLVQVATSGSNAARGGLVAAVFGATDRARARAYLRSMSNLGISLGAVGAGVVLRLDTRPAYLALVLVDAASFAVTALLVSQVRGTTAGEPAPLRAGGLRRFSAVTDLRYLTVTAVNAVMVLSYTVLEVALPLWIVHSTTAPRWTIAPLLLVNTAMCVVFQVRASRGLDDVAAAARAIRTSGVFFAAGFALLAATAHRSVGLTVALLVLAMVVQTLGELRQAGGSFGLSYALARPGSQSQYQGVWGLGFGVSQAAGPALLVGLVIGWGATGWFVLGAMLLSAGCLMPLAVRWAAANRVVVG